MRAVDAWAVHLEASRSTSTADTYVKHVRWLADAMAKVEPWDVTAEQLETWMNSKPWSLGTRAKVLVSVRAFYAFAMDQGWCHRSPVAGVTVTHRRPGPVAASPRHIAWAQAVGDYLVWLQAGGRGLGTVRIRRWHLYDLSEHCADPWAVTVDDLAAWLSRADHSPEYRRALRGSVRSFYRWAVMTERSKRNPAEHLEPVKIPRALPRPITRDALTEALTRADDRQRLILYLAAMAGLRRAEIAGLHFQDMVGDQVLLVRGKGGHQRIVPLHPHLQAELQLERNRRRAGSCGTGWVGPYVHADGYVFPSSLTPEPLTPKHVAKVAGDCLPTGWTLHTLRHRFASQAYASQRDLRAVQELLGHMKPETTARYAAVPDGAKLAAVAGVGL